jgi:hypothetical protein
VIPDVQAKPGVSLDHLDWIGRYIADKKPDVIIQLGDFADMPSLSSYDKGKKESEGRRYESDIATVHEAMRRLCSPFKKIKRYKPKMVLTLGNHEDRITRAVSEDPKLDGKVSLEDLKYEKWGWQVYPFLQPAIVDGIMYLHYLPTGVKGNPATSASALVTKAHMSVTVGHIQTTDVCFKHRANGERIIGLMAGACYLHDEDYLPAVQNAATARQIVMKHEVWNGDYDIMMVSLNYLRRKYS